MTRQASNEELFRDGFWKEMNKLNTAIPCIVINVQNDFKEQLVDVQPAINYVQKDGTFTERPPIIGVPVVQIGNTNTALTMPVEAGDTVLCIFSMRAIEIWQESDGKPSNPNNRAKLHEKDAIAIPGLFPRKKAVNNPSRRTLPHSTKDTVLAHNIGKANEVEIRFKPNGDLLITSPSKVEVNCSQAVINAEDEITFNTPNATFTGSVQVNETLTANDDVYGGGKSLKNHTHPVAGVQTGSATVISQPPS